MMEEGVLPEEEPPSIESFRKVKSTSHFMFRSSCALPPPDDTTNSAGGASLISFAESTEDQQPRFGRFHSVGGERIPEPKPVVMEKPSPVVKQTKAVAFREADSFFGESSLSHSLESGSYPGLGMKIEFPGRLGECQNNEPGVETSATENETASSPTNHSRAAWSALTGDGGTHSTNSFWIEGQARKLMYLLSCLLILLIVGSLTLAGMCAKTYCHRRSKFIPDETSPPFVPTRPTPSPVNGRIFVVSTTEELYAAVDTYLEDPNAIDPINEWDVSTISDFTSVFDADRNPAARTFQHGLLDWDTSRAVYMDYMFRGALMFNGDISRFKTESVISMESMFEDAHSFDGLLGIWNVSNVWNMRNMFLNAFSFKGVGLEQWDTSSVVDMCCMFKHTFMFNGDLSQWKVGIVKNMTGMFHHSKRFNADLSEWDTGEVEDMSEMVSIVASKLVDSHLLATVSRGKSIPRCFIKMERFQLYNDGSNGEFTFLRLRNISSIVLDSQFTGASAFRDNLCGWPEQFQDGGNNVQTTSMFLVSGCEVTTDPVFFSRTQSFQMCERCGLLEGNTLQPDNSPPLTPVPFEGRSDFLDAVDDFLALGGDSFALIEYGGPIGIWDVSRITNFEGIFDAERNDNARFFNEDLSGWNVSSAITMDRMFAGAAAFNGNISTWITSKVETMYGMFNGARSFQGDLSSLDTSRVVDMSHMFEEADRFNGVLNFDTSRVVDMSYMFRSALSFSGNGLSSWSTSQCMNTTGMFEEAISLRADLAGWEVSNVITMERMFRFANSWNSDISRWDVSLVKSFSLMFNGASTFNRDLSRWNVSGSNFDGMFAGAISFNQNSCAWGEKVARVNQVSTQNMFVASACHIVQDPDVAEYGPYCAACSPTNL